MCRLVFVYQTSLFFPSWECNDKLAHIFLTMQETSAKQHGEVTRMHTGIYFKKSLASCLMQPCLFLSMCDMFARLTRPCVSFLFISRKSQHLVTSLNSEAETGMAEWNNTPCQFRNSRKSPHRSIVSNGSCNQKLPDAWQSEHLNWSFVKSLFVSCRQETWGRSFVRRRSFVWKKRKKRTRCCSNNVDKKRHSYSRRWTNQFEQDKILSFCFFPKFYFNIYEKLYSLYIWE